MLQNSMCMYIEREQHYEGEIWGMFKLKNYITQWLGKHQSSVSEVYCESFNPDFNKAE